MAIFVIHKQEISLNPFHKYSDVESMAELRNLILKDLEYIHEASKIILDQSFTIPEKVNLLCSINWYCRQETHSTICYHDELSEIKILFSDDQISLISGVTFTGYIPFFQVKVSVNDFNQKVINNDISSFEDIWETIFLKNLYKR